MLVNKKIFSDQSGNELRLSSVIQTEQPVSFRDFSAKCVVSGNENYLVNNRKINLNQGEYLVGNQNNTSSVLVDNALPTNGICVDVAKGFITDVIDFQYQNNAAFTQFLFAQEWMTQKHHVASTSLGNAFRKLANDFEPLKNGHTTINHELFYFMAECIVSDQMHGFESFHRLKAAKSETNGRLFNFVHDAKNYIDDHFLEKINIQTIAREAKLSEYHFIRLFKTIFKTTPYKYLVQKRLQFAAELLKNRQPISDIAVVVGYNDLAAFSNAFKNQFGISPANLKIN